MSELSAADKNALKTSLESKEALAQGNANLIESEKLAQEAVQASKHMLNHQICLITWIQMLRKELKMALTQCYPILIFLK